MRLNLCVVLLMIIFSGSKAMAQDLIVTNVGDSISCDIRKETRTEVHFSYLRYNQNIVRTLGKDRISSVVRGFYVNDSIRSAEANSFVPDKELQTNSSAQGMESTMSHDTATWTKWQAGIHVGYARRLFRSAISATDYERLYDQKLKPGISAGAEAFYFPWKSVGFGLRYDFYLNRAERDIKTHDKVNIQFLGLGVAHRKIFSNRSTSLLTSFLVGYQPYHNAARHIGQDYKLNANTMGWAVSVGLDHRISQKLAIGLSGSCMMGSIFKFRKTYKGHTEVVNLSHHEQEDLSRASVSLALKFVK